MNAPAKREGGPFSDISPRAGALGLIVRTYQAAVTRLCKESGLPFAWQRNSYEHIIRNEADLDRTRQYIIANPAQWEEDEYYRT